MITLYDADRCPYCARVRAVARVAASPSELPPPRELLQQIADVMNLEARIER